MAFVLTYEQLTLANCSGKSVKSNHNHSLHCSRICIHWNQLGHATYVAYNEQI